MSEPSPPPATQDRPFTWRGKLVAVLLFAALVAAIVQVARWMPRKPDAALPERSTLQLDLSRPDALIESASLARLPKDLLRVPLLRDALSEDLVFHYRSNAERLGIVGSLRRIAYEHDLDLGDALVEQLLDQPAQIALWRAADGKLAHALLRLRRGALASVLQPLARIAADDRQLAQVGTLRVDGNDVPVLRLRYNHDRALLLVAHDDELLVLTSPQMLQGGDEREGAVARVESSQIERLLDGRLDLAERFGLKARSAIHRITLDAGYLALGYGRFVPQFAGVRVEMDDAGWRSWLALNSGSTVDLSSLWQVMPSAAAACAAAPVSPNALQPLFERLAIEPALAARLQGPVALCWYGSSRLHTPLLATRLSGTAGEGDIDAALGDAFQRVIGTREPANDGERFAVQRSVEGGGVRWQRVVGSDFGGYPASAHEASSKLNNPRFFRVTLARHDDVLLFSLDDALVDKALATRERRFPPLAEVLPSQRQVPLYFEPSALAALLEREALDSLPADMEPVFRNAAERHLLPKLRAMGTHAGVAMALPADIVAGSDWQWLPIEWVTR